MKKRALSLLMAFVMVIGLLPATARAAENVFEIRTAEDLSKVSGSNNYVLMNDIDLSGTSYTGAVISDVSAPGTAFSGTFDGQNHTISGLNIETESANGVGLFGTVNGATIQNLKAEGAVKATNSAFVGGIVGKVQNCATIKNCSFTGTVANTKTSGSNVAAGGIVGRVNTIASGKSLSIEGCANHAAVSAPYAGGILGYATAKAITIESCYNDASVTGSTEAGGIFARITASASVENCYNSGTVGNKTYGGIAGFSGAAILNCYWTRLAVGKGGGTGALNEDKNYGKVDSIASVAKKLGDAFDKDASGNVILKWETSSTPAEKNPRIVISGGSTLQMTNSDEPHTTLTVAYKDMEGSTPAVTWSTSNDCVTLTAPATASAADNIRIAQANEPGTVTITATVTYNGESYSDSVVITVIPHITYVDIINPTSSVIALGQTVEAQVSVGGKPYLASYPELKYQWWHYDTSTGNADKITNATGKSYTIPETYAYNRIQVEVTCNGVTVSEHNQHKTADVLSGNDALLAFDKAALTLEKLGVSSTTITAETTLTLPNEGENGSTITWESSDSSVIDPKKGKVTLPAEDKQEVTLTAKLTLNGKKAELPITFVVKSKTAQAVDADKETLEKAAKSLSTLHPRFGKDSNVQTMVETRLANAGFSGVGVKFISAEPTKATAVQAASAISSIGGITYFYDDPNKTVNERTQWFDTYKAHFTLTCGSEARENVAVPVTVYWDVNRVSRVMTEEVLDRVTLPELTEENLNLPTVVEGKQWAKIVWTSSDPGIISDNGVVTRSAIDRQTVLTASFTFQRTNDVTGSEPPIVLYKMFEVTVKAVQNGADRNEQYQAALEGALSDPGLRDFVTGKKLTANENGVYTTVNDIQFPTTRDLKIDGKYTPVVITSSDTAVIETPDVANAARVNIYRPLPGEAAKTVTLTVKVLDRPSGSGRDYANLPVLAEKSVIVSVQPLTQAEIDAEIALMAKVKDAYWDGICNGNAEEDNITTDLHAFQECYLGTGGQLTWVYDRKYLKNHGIVPVPLDNWYDQQIWRLFRSSNADVVAHENLLVSRQKESKAVTVTSYLSSETLGKYAEKYPQNADFQKLYKQPVTIDLVVTGTKYAQGGNSTVRKQAARYALSNRAMLTVDFTLTGSGMGFSETKLKYAEGSTAFDVFSDMLAKHRYTCKRRGSYIASITSDGGKTLEEFDEGKNSGWMYRVNGELASKYMSAQGLKDGDRIEIYFTSDWTSEPGAGSRKPVTPVTKGETPTGANGSATKVETKPDGTVVETTTKPDGTTVETTAKPDGSFRAVEKRADGTTVETSAPAGGGITASVSVPKKVGSTRVDLPVSAPTGGMVAVLVHPDGTEEILKNSVVTDTGIAFRAEGTMQVRIADNANHFEDTQKHWAKEAVEFASARELFNGVSGSEFAPDLPMTRGMVNTVLARLAGVDTSGGEQWYTKGTEWAKANGISDGTNPEQEVTREQLAAMLYRYADSPAVSGALRFDDAGAVSDWAYAAVKWCAENGIMNGVGSNLAAPQGLARRGQVAAMLMRFLRATL